MCIFCVKVAGESAWTGTHVVIIAWRACKVRRRRDLCLEMCDPLIYKNTAGFAGFTHRMLSKQCHIMRYNSHIISGRLEVFFVFQVL